MKRIYLKLAIVLAAAALTACNDEGIDVTDIPSSGNALVLNNGNWGGNDACVTLYNTKTGEVTGNAFMAANSQALGDLGQDVLVDGDNVYIAVNGSQLIFVTDRTLKVKHTIVAETAEFKLSPRSLAKADGKVYVTYYEGYLGEIDPSNGYKVRIVQVGSSPEGLAYAGGKVYVANSGGMNYPDYDNTLSVVDTATFTVIGTIEVNFNPAKVYAAGDYLYVSSFGNYADAPAKLQCVDVRTGVVTDTPYSGVSSIALGDDSKLYVLCGGYDAAWNPLPGTVYVHNAKANTPSSASELVPFVKDETTFPNAYSLSAAADGYVYVGCSDYVSTGDVYAMTSEGTLHAKFDSKGLNPIAVVAF